MAIWSGNTWNFTEPIVLYKLPCSLPLTMPFPSRLNGGSALSQHYLDVSQAHCIINFRIVKLSTIHSSLYL